jgi:hypothetical protein
MSRPRRNGREARAARQRTRLSPHRDRGRRGEVEGDRLAGPVPPVRANEEEKVSGTQALRSFGFARLLPRRPAEQQPRRGPASLSEAIRSATPRHVSEDSSSAGSPIRRIEERLGSQRGVLVNEPGVSFPTWHDAVPHLRHQFPSSHLGGAQAASRQGGAARCLALAGASVAAGLGLGLRRRFCVIAWTPAAPPATTRVPQSPLRV